MAISNLEDELPESPLERASMLEGLLTERATGGSPSNQVYQVLRSEFMANTEWRDLLPPFVRTYRSLDAFWPFIKGEAATYAERREIIRSAFTPLFDHLEGRGRSPMDPGASDVLERFDAEGVHAVWTKALSRRSSDPEGAITIARTLLETVCKRILDETATPYTGKEDLPKLYGMVAGLLNLAPNQHVEEPFKAILGNAMGMVNGIGTLRNRFSDSHAPGGKKPVRPSPRHASLAVNTAGAIAAFLVETYVEGTSASAG